MSAMPSIATEFVRRNEPTRCAKSGRKQSEQTQLIFDHLVGSGEQRWRHRRGRALGGLRFKNSSASKSPRDARAPNARELAKPWRCPCGSSRSEANSPRRSKASICARRSTLLRWRLSMPAWTGMRYWCFTISYLTDEQQPAFTKSLGKIELNTANNVTSFDQRRLSIEMSDISNFDQHSNMLARDDRRRAFNLGNRLWHSDSSFKSVSAKYSLLSARIIPSAGGNTEFADMRAAYDVLDPEIKAEIEDSITEHSLLFSRGQLGFSDFTAEERVQFAPVRHRLVRTNTDDRSQVAVPVFPHRRHRRLAGAGSNGFRARSCRARDPATIRRRPHLAAT